MAPAICCEPPRATGHPTRWAIAPSTSPNDAVGGLSSGIIECAAIPAKIARALSSLNTTLASNEAGSSAFRPKRASATGCRGNRSGPSKSRPIFGQSSTNGPIRARYARASLPRLASAAVAATERSITTAVPSSSG
jgi:hypothetical protein